MKKRLTALALALALAASVWALLFWPVFIRFDAVHAGRLPGPHTITGLTLWQAEGLYGLALVLLPVSLALAPLLYPRQWLRVVAGIVLPVFALGSGFSIGMFYAPSAFLILLAACVDDSARLRDAVP